MIILIHQNARQVVKVLKGETEIKISATDCTKAFLELAGKYPEEFIGWCEEKHSTDLNLPQWSQIFHHNLIMASYNLDMPYLRKEIGYVEESPFIEIKKNVSYPTWQMGSEVGGIHAQVLLRYKGIVPPSRDFNYFLNSLGKIGQQQGLFCYSEPALLKDQVKPSRKNNSQSLNVLFRFVWQHYKSRWFILLMINCLVYDRRLPLLPFFLSLGFRKRNRNLLDLENIKINSSRKVLNECTLDVILPTIGRKEYLYNVLKDLAAQTCQPDRVIIVEQNPDQQSKSELDYIYQEKWPFNVKHIFTHQTGVCNARNLALEEVENEWTFFNDDDNRLQTNYIELTFQNIKKYGVAACITALNDNNSREFPYVAQTTTFGSGYSFVKSEYLRKTGFSEELEFGYGEDKDFGMQLRKKGVDVIYFPEPLIKHLNAPVGGFRSFQIFPWSNVLPIPKPSPTVMWYKRKHLSREQILGYKTILFLNTLKKRKMKEIVNFNKSWNASEKWAKKL